MNFLRLIGITMLLLSGGVFAQASKATNGRVKEVESFVSKKSLDFIRGRFPGIPVLISVKIDPMKQTGDSLIPGVANNSLPYLDFGAETAIDPWDNASSTVHELLTRVNFIELKITLPNTVEDDLIFEVRDALFSNLGMISGRDRIEFVRKNWPGQTELVIEYFIFGTIATILVLIGLFLIARSAFEGLKAAIKSAADNASGGATQAPVAPMNASNKESKGDKNIQLNDSMKVAEKLESLVWKLADDPAFPTLEDMMDLEKKAIENPEMIGALLKEMPADLQNKLFTRGKDPIWLETFFTDGKLNMEAYQFVQTLTRRVRKEEETQWQDFLIALWRLDRDLTPFMRTLEQRDALGVFAWMPIEISLPAATEAFPGAWGILLKHDFKPPVLDNETTQDLINKALEIRPYNAVEMLERYRHERGLIKYLKTCPLETEKDIYKAAKEGGTLRVVRPPFYEVLEAGETVLKAFIHDVAIRDWGISLFNIDRSLRGAITNHLNDRERFVLIETLKECDMTGISHEEVGDAREAIARSFTAFKEKFEAESEANKTSGNNAQQDSDSGNQQNNAA